MLKTKMKITITMECIVNTERSDIAEKSMLAVLRDSLRISPTLQSLYDRLSSTDTIQINYSRENEVIDTES